jgi:hypothetical protein
MKKSLVSASLFLLVRFVVSAQDTLPDFSVKNIGNNRIIVSWTNTYPLVKQISIQRSFDSLVSYKTILSVPDPMAPENGFADTKAPPGRLFYRLFIVFDQGNFLFTKAQRPVLDTAARSKPDLSKIDKIAMNDSASSPLTNLPGNVSLENKNNPPLFVPSLHVYTYKDGNVRINLPDNSAKKYSIKFFEEDNTELFTINEIKETPVLLDKSNFYHAGWFHFELYEDGKLIEKNKFYLAKPF